MPELLPLNSENISPVFFETDELPFPIPGMSDVMPYKSTRFSNFTPEMLEIYLQSFSRVITHTVNQFQPHIIHTHHLWLVTALTRILNPEIPVVTTCHGTELRQLLLAPHLKPFVIPGCSQVDRVFALHPLQEKQLNWKYQIPHERIELIGAGYRNDIFCRDHVSQKKDRPAKELRVVYAGKISRAKGVPWLISAMQHITVPEGFTLRLFLAGSSGSSEGEDILSEIGGSESQIEYVGPLSQKKLAALLKTADLFVLPSFYEGLPLVILEALACGCRIVVTDIPGLTSWLPEKLVQNDIVKQIPLPRLKNADVPYPEDLPDFQKNLSDAVSYQLKQAATTGECRSDLLDVCVDKLSWESIFTKIEKVYRKLCSENKT
jgi:glycosyltransferase involved in cell wall biosynthesis